MRRRAARAVALAVAVALGSLTLAACGGPSATAPTTVVTGPVWLCRPGVAPDPCDTPVSVTSIPAVGARTVAPLANDVDSPFDCFYVYPTVSTEPRANANLRIQASEIAAAVSQASPFSSVCRVYAPLYRQRTTLSLAQGLASDPAADLVAYRSLLAAWRDYLAHDNDGRPVIFLGHSQGAAVLIRLLESSVDNNVALRDRTVSAILLGANVAVPTGALVGATFRHLPLCTSASDTGCVVAYSSFPAEPPVGSLFGRPGTGVSAQSGQTATTGVQVACVNPANLSGGSGVLAPLFLTSVMEPPAPRVTTRWVTYPGLYRARCESAGGATWLQVSAATGPRDPRPRVSEVLGPRWGYHVDDVALGLGNLLALVTSEESAYLAAHHARATRR